MRTCKAYVKEKATMKLYQRKQKRSCVKKKEDDKEGRNAKMKTCNVYVSIPQ